MQDIKLLPKSEQTKIKVLTGETPDEERKQMLKDFSDGKILCIINCMVLTEGTDLPICDTVINLRPTCNASLYQQMVGRGTRLFSGKDHCLINLSFAPQKIAATPKQVSYAKSLILRAQGYENYFPGVDPQHFDRRQAQLFIGLLVMLDSQHERVPRTFTDACEVLRDVSLHAPFKRCYRFHYVSQNDLSTDAAMSS